MAVARVQALIEQDIKDLRPALERIASERIATNTALLWPREVAISAFDPNRKLARGRLTGMKRGIR
jgi:hypothetical protein